MVAGTHAGDVLYPLVSSAVLKQACLVIRTDEEGVGEWGGDGGGSERGSGMGMDYNAWRDDREVTGTHEVVVEGRSGWRGGGGERGKRMREVDNALGGLGGPVKVTVRDNAKRRQRSNRDVIIRADKYVSIIVIRLVKELQHAITITGTYHVVFSPSVAYCNLISMDI